MRSIAPFLPGVLRDKLKDVYSTLLMRNIYHLFVCQSFLPAIQQVIITLQSRISNPPKINKPFLAASKLGDEPRTLETIMTSG